ncbi:MAG TPA: helix-turn-helix transcriptional regulator [Stellaceae bacterium]|jgi:transcriptional regulator with XRE-family HTH domain|nr:helix-turn-helix transcriptional regulator [Stellaceae bacterium]
MTPFGAHIRNLREARGITLVRMAEDLGISAAYLSAMEHGKRPRPRPNLVRQICGYLNIIWDEADALQALAESYRPVVRLDTGGLSPKMTELANMLAERLAVLPEATADEIMAILASIPTPPTKKRRRARRA